MNTTAAYEVITFVKEVVEKFPDLRDAILRRLILALPHVKSGKVFRGASWVIGEYALEESLIQESWKYIRGSIGEVPIIASELKLKSVMILRNHKRKKPSMMVNLAERVQLYCQMVPTLLSQH